jgi:hypothetical protein
MPRPGGYRAHTMKQIADFFRRVWQRDRSASNIRISVTTDKPDRSSMADFVRILQAQDQDGPGRR